MVSLLEINLDMPLRHRSYSIVGRIGSRTYLPTGHVDTELVGGIESSCDDVVGNFPNPNPLSILKVVKGDGSFSGKSTVFPVFLYDGYPYTNQPTATLPSGWDTGMPDLVTSVTQVASKTNPGRADLSVPVFIAELKDLPDMLHIGANTRYQKAIGKYKKPKASNSVPTEHFGWSPFFRDLSSLLDFTAHVDKRVKELMSVYSSRGEHRNKKVWANNYSLTESNVPFQTVENSCYGDRVTTVTAKRWASIRWRPTFPPPSMPSRPDLLQKARFAVHGWRINPSDAWELIPWSWLADYFGNVGSMLETYGNAWEYQCSDGCVMTEILVHVSDRPYGDSPGFTTIPAVASRTYKIRDLATPGLSLFGQLLSPKQLTNLAAIAANYGGVKK